MIEYKRGRRKDTIVSERMVFPSRCGRYRIERCDCKFDEFVRWYAVAGEKLLLTKRQKPFRTRKAAEKAINKHAKNNSQVLRRAPAR